jgi:hypothetical protein
VFVAIEPTFFSLFMLVECLLLPPPPPHILGFTVRDNEFAVYSKSSMP